MIKTHNITGLKYLCKCTHDSFIKYTGSGKYWKRHIKKHGREISTEIIFQTDDFEKFKEFCILTSVKLNVVDSDEWANLIHETGCDGGITINDPFWLKGFKHSEETKIKIGEASKRMWLNGKGPIINGKPHTEETKQRISNALKGREKTIQHREAMSKAHKERSRNPISESHKNSLSKSLAQTSSKIYKCNICNRNGNLGQLARYHKECKLNEFYKPEECDERSSDLIEHICIMCNKIFLRKRSSKNLTCGKSCSTKLYWETKTNQNEQ